MEISSVGSVLFGYRGPVPLEVPVLAVDNIIFTTKPTKEDQPLLRLQGHRRQPLISGFPPVNQGASKQPTFMFSGKTMASQPPHRPLPSLIVEPPHQPLLCGDNQESILRACLWKAKGAHVSVTVSEGVVANVQQPYVPKRRWSLLEDAKAPYAFCSSWGEDVELVAHCSSRDIRDFR
ncbi:hypothetical protein L2E82_01433 [Cichorium intybus]|uniref:Uncharacterized protein n=1 Tax=Cichorium intybus TaxID=13427 RepID=A0ACB9H0F9_CICIN|nr:hypothetical protein L2E82_01433 [Cichorium intybus]